MKRILTTITITAMAICILATVALAWPGTVVSVQDGDTIVVKREDGTKEKIRLFGVDCPESEWTGRWMSQPYSRVATNFVKALFKGDGKVDVAIWEEGESYGRIVGGVITLHNGRTVQEEIVRAGLAWVDPKYCKRSRPQCRAWMELEKQAARARRGLWKDLDGKNKPVSPWQWRKGAYNE